MNYPFTVAQFLEVFGIYNQAVWPMQIVFYLAALLVALLILKRYPISDRAISLVLSFFWLWMGIVYHLVFFSSINPVARIFGGVFILQGVFLLYQGVIKNKMDFSRTSGWYLYLGFFFMVFGTVIYPFLGYLFGHSYPNSPTFGLPCPTTIFTIGTFLVARKIPRYLMIIPVLWTLVGSMAALSFGITQDYFLAISGLVAIFYIVRK